MRRLTLAVLAVLSALTTSAFAQSDRGSIKGLVVDQQDRVIAGAAVTLTNTATGVRVQATTDDSGNFLFPSLIVGSYEVTTEFTGFKKSVQPDVQVEVGRTSALTITLSPGAMAETVTVEAAPPCSIPRPRRRARP